MPITSLFANAIARSAAVLLALLGSMGMALAHGLPEHDAMTAATQHHKTLLENDSVRVLETRIRPGERTAVHFHPWPAALYVVSFSDFVRYDPDGHVLADSRLLNDKPQPGSEGERNSTAVARVSPGVREKARCVKTREFGELVTAVFAQRAADTGGRRRPQ